MDWPLDGVHAGNYRSSHAAETVHSIEWGHSANPTHYPCDPDTLFQSKRLPLIVPRKCLPSAHWDR